MPIKPSSKEEEYMLQIELERRRKFAQEEEARLAEEMRQSLEEQRRSLKEAHWMHCPKCGTTLQEVEYRGVHLDQCPGCGGIFLDAGELDQVAQADTGGFLGSLGRIFRT